MRRIASPESLLKSPISSATLWGYTPKQGFKNSPRFSRFT